MPDSYATWLARDVVAARGPDAATFLQGQLSQDVHGLDDGRSTWSWVLAPSGKVDALVRVTRVANHDWLLDTDSGWGEALVARLSRFKLRTKVELEMLAWKVLGLRGSAVDRAAVDKTAGVVAASPWPAMAGVDLLGDDPLIPSGIPVVSPEDYDAERIVAGMPRMGTDLTEKTIPAETGLNNLTVSFTKGCYTGQELVARIDSRGGNVPRHLRGLALPGQLDPGTELVDADGKVAGVITSVGHSDQRGWVGLGYVRRGAETLPTLRGGPDGPEVGVGELPQW